MIALYNHDNEKWLIGALLQDPEMQKQLPAIPLGWMHDPANEAVLAAMKALHANHDPIEMLTVDNTLRNGSEMSVGTDYLVECLRMTPTTVNSAYYLRELEKLYKAREAYKKGKALCERLLAGEDADAAVDAARTELREMASSQSKIIRMDEMSAQFFDDVERRSRGETYAMLTHVPDLDRLIVGLEPTDLAVIGARPMVGKSAFGMQIAINAAIRGKNVMICSREMSILQYAYRIASNLSAINGIRLKRAKLQESEWESLGNAVNAMSQLPIAFTFSVKTVEELRVQAQHEKDMGRLDLLVVDYLQILGTSQKTNQRYEAVGHVSRALKEIALDLQVPVIAMSQVGRQTIAAGAQRAPMMPDLSDLRESGNIEQDADIVIFLHHPAGASDPSIPGYDAENQKTIEEREGMQYIVVKVAKQRQGECGSFGIAFDAAHMTYLCLSR